MSHREDAVKMVTTVLLKHKADLERVGLNAVFNPLRIWGGTDKPWIEVEIHFEKDGNIEDALEFNILEEGKPKASLDELKEWLNDSISDVIRQMVGPPTSPS